MAVSSLTLVDGFHPSWDADLLVATLAGQSLHRLRIEDGRVLFDEPIPVGKRIRYAHQHTDGRIVLWTDDQFLIFLSPADLGLVASFIDDYIAGREFDEPLEARVRSAIAGCMECHSFEVGGGTNAPTLAGVHGRRVAGSTFPSYSPALRRQGGMWDRKALIAFLGSPQAFAPGTTMPSPNLGDDPAVLEAVANVLEALPGPE